ncbi:hypothetical protein LAJ19_21330 (plasmid) [Deinococcus taeanensis]|nr:hypothetical protein LAJ19_21330 [Deinococcus taeanensis]
MERLVTQVRQAAGDLPLQVFGTGHPEQLARMRRLGVDSVDSSSDVKYAADGRLYTHPRSVTCTSRPTSACISPGLCLAPGDRPVPHTHAAGPPGRTSPKRHGRRLMGRRPPIRGRRFCSG